MPLIREVHEDRLVWREEQNREYTVKSRYRILMQEKEEGRRRGMEGSWHILWRICRDCLPTRVQLRQHHVSCPISCELCNRENEDIWLVLFECESSKNCWTAAGLQNIVTARLHALNNAKDVAGRVARMIWLIWKNRNQWLWSQERKEATQLGVQAYHMWDDWYKAQNFKSNTQQLRPMNRNSSITIGYR
ncbi:hypothetical protein TSUD_291630 [Trifolium subterraneum]|uniref:Reverse transcriptase zinc-binding domain-containing protein n=1 Tax=Trifolium subterraneum TaxID=3900 RepID=A0A2Z6NWH2_TRISU|nr:hypothetical protein TSUD_291630 [Trifolium subterraneum]